MNEALIRMELAASIRMLEYLGLIDFSGHVSYRVPETDTLYINNWGGSRCSLTPDDIVTANLEGEPTDPDVILPSEIHIHTEIYRRRPEVLAVSHLHPPVTTAVSVAGKAYVPVMHHGAIFPSGVPVHDNCGHVNSKEKGRALAETLGGQRAVIMRGHGAVVVAESIRGVFFGSVYLEDNAKKLAEAYKMGGEPCRLREDELQAAGKIWRQNQFDKIWRYYVEKSGVNFN